MLTTALTRALAIDHPIIQAGMSSDCGAKLAAAVSNAGALGTIGSLGRSPEDLEAELAAMRSATSRPWSVNLATFDWAPFAGTLVDVAIDARPPVVTLSFGDTLSVLERCRAAGLQAVVQVQTFESARAVVAARPAAIVVQGSEAGGHTGQRGTLSFAAQVLDIAGGVPVVIAGGIADGRGLAAALAMGASGVLIGSRRRRNSAGQTRGTWTPSATPLWRTTVITPLVLRFPTLPWACTGQRGLLAGSSRTRSRKNGRVAKRSCAQRSRGSQAPSRGQAHITIGQKTCSTGRVSPPGSWAKSSRQPKSCGARSPRPRTTCAVPAVCARRKPSPGGGCPRGRSNPSSLPSSFAPPAGVRSAPCTRYSGRRRRIRA